MQLRKIVKNRGHFPSDEASDLIAGDERQLLKPLTAQRTRPQSAAVPSDNRARQKSNCAAVIPSAAAIFSRDDLRRRGLLSCCA
jgi:hypothetical protein